MKVTKKITMFIASLGIIGLAGGVLGLPAYAAADCNGGSGIDCINVGANNAKTGGANSSNLTSVFQLVTNILLFLIGAISVIMIVVGGLKYTTSNGNAEMIKSAKNTIMYAIVGVIVAILAYAIVNFVISKLT